MTRAEDPASDRDLIARRTFVELADTLDPGYDLEASVGRLAQACVRLLGVSGVSVILAAEPAEKPGLAAGSTDQLARLARLELDCAEGPGMDCFRKIEAVWCPELPREGDGQWPAYFPAALNAGYGAVHALPLCYRGTAIGAISLYGRESGQLDPDTIHLAQALADLATVGFLHYREARDRRLVIQQLQNALDSRVVIEQAKGILAERLGVPVDDAFGVLRGHARSSRTRLSAIARGVIDGTVDIAPPTP